MPDIISLRHSTKLHEKLKIAILKATLPGLYTPSRRKAFRLVWSYVRTGLEPDGELPIGGLCSTRMMLPWCLTLFGKRSGLSISSRRRRIGFPPSPSSSFYPARCPWWTGAVPLLMGTNNYLHCSRLPVGRLGVLDTFVISVSWPRLFSADEWGSA